MHKLVTIQYEEERRHKMKPYFKTCALDDEQDELWGRSDERGHFKVDDLVERWFNDEWNQAQMRHGKSCDMCHIKGDV